MSKRSVTDDWLPTSESYVDRVLSLLHDDQNDILLGYKVQSLESDSAVLNDVWIASVRPPQDEDVAVRKEDNTQDDSVFRDLCNHSLDSADQARSRQCNVKDGSLSREG